MTYLSEEVCLNKKKSKAAKASKGAIAVVGQGIATNFARSRIFSHARPFYEQAVSDLGP
jgi:hypothetical protein